VRLDGVRHLQYRDREQQHDASYVKGSPPSHRALGRTIGRELASRPAGGKLSAALNVMTRIMLSKTAWWPKMDPSSTSRMAGSAKTKTIVVVSSRGGQQDGQQSADDRERPGGYSCLEGCPPGDEEGDAVEPGEEQRCARGLRRALWPEPWSVRDRVPSVRTGRERAGTERGASMRRSWSADGG